MRRPYFHVLERQRKYKKCNALIDHCMPKHEIELFVGHFAKYGERKTFDYRNVVHFNIFFLHFSSLDTLPFDNYYELL